MRRFPNLYCQKVLEEAQMFYPINPVDPDDPPPPAGVSIYFSETAVIFEDEYTNMPGQVVQWQSTTTKLTLEAHGGMKGGTATFTFTNKEKLIGPDIPTSITVPAGHCKTYEFTYRGNLPSGSEEDITVHGEFHEYTYRSMLLK